jgi:hypothetical protein
MEETSTKFLTKEYLLELTKKIEDVYFVRTGYKPENINLEKENFLASHSVYICCGDYDYFQETITVEDLNSNIDELLKQKEAEMERKILEASMKKQKEKELKEIQEKEKRYKEYLKLKEEFEGLLNENLKLEINYL